MYWLFKDVEIVASVSKSIQTEETPMTDTHNLQIYNPRLVKWESRGGELQHIQG